MYDKNESNEKFAAKTRNCMFNRAIGKTKNYQIKPGDSLSKVLLKGKLFGLINKCNIMTDEKFNEIKTKISSSNPKNYKAIKRKNKEEGFYYAEKNPRILNTEINSNKFEDDHINARDFISRNFTSKEQKLIFKYPQYFKLSSIDALKEIAPDEHKNLSEIISMEERKELLSHKKQKLYSLTPKFPKFSVLNKKNNQNLYTNLSSIKKFPLTPSSKMATTFNFSVKTFNNVFTPKIYKSINFNLNNVEIRNKEIKEEIKEKEQKMIEKFERIQKRREQYQKDKNNYFIEIHKKNLNEQKMKEKDRNNKYNEKKYIDLILKKIKKNYN